MAFKKIAQLQNYKIEALNNPGWDIYNMPAMVKTASIEKSKEQDLGGFDIEAAVTKHPDNLFIKIFAIKEDETNDNGDYFSADELEKSAQTFVGVPIFTNHQNDDIEKSRGECVHSWYDKELKGIFIVARVDKVAYPKLARGVEEGYVKGTSMGCSVDHSVCSICHNKAHTADEYCTHIKNQKTRKLSTSCKCKYHESKVQVDEKCPICSCTKKEASSLKHDNQQVFEYNYGLKFIENSFVVNPACHTCGVECILNEPELNKKVASLRASVTKLSSKYENNPKSVKNAGQNEIVSLKQAMDQIEKVARSMLAQKDQVDMEFVSELVKLMSDLQGTTDELIEVGYGQLPSPPISTASNVGDVSFPSIQSGNAQPQQASSAPSGQTMQSHTTKTPNAIQTDLGGGIGSITKPASTTVVNKKKDFIRISSNLLSKIYNLQNKVSKSARRTTVSDSIIHIWDDSEDVSSLNVSLDKEHVTLAQGDKILKIAHVSQFSPELQDLIKSNPFEAVQRILNISKESTTNMSDNQNKTAAIGPADSDSPAQREVITEKQLKSSPPTLHPRWGDTYEQTTESKDQLGRSDDKSNDTTSDSPQKRLGTYETITEDQMSTISSGHVVRTNDWPEVITEKQWTDMSRLVSADLSDDWDSRITESQIKDLLSSHSFVGPYETTTEDQLKKQDSGVKRWASKNYVDAITKVAVESISDAIALFNKSPNDLSKVVSSCMNDSALKNKVAFLSVVNSLPRKNEDIHNLINNVNYFSKKASKSLDTPESVDALIISIANNAKSGIKSEDIIDTISYILSKKEAMAKVENRVQTKIASKKANIETVFDKFSSIDSSLVTLDRPKDGLWRIEATLKEVKAMAKGEGKKAFVSAAKRFAIAQIGPELGGKDLTLLSIKFDPATGSVTIDAGDASMLGNKEPEVDELLEDNNVMDSNGHDDDDILADDLVSDEMDDMDDMDDYGDNLGDEGMEEDNDCGMGMGKPAMPGIGSGGAGMGDTGMGQTKPAMPGSLSPMASKRNGIKKQAQMMGGEMGGQGGASQAPGAGATLPQPPMADAGMESISGGDEELAGEEELGDMQPKPPGSICPVCGSEDVDIVSGEGHCSNCGSQFKFKVTLEVSKWSGLLGEDQEDGEEEGDGLTEGEGFEMPGEEAMPPAAGGMGAPGPEVPVAAMTRLSPESLQKIAKMIYKIKATSGSKNATKSVSEGGYGLNNTMLQSYASKDSVKLGSISPLTGTDNTLHLGGSEYVCLSTGTKYKVSFIADKKNPKYVYAQWSYTPKSDANACPTCQRMRNKFTKQLAGFGVSETQWDQMSIAERSKTLVNMKKAGSLKEIKTADKLGSVLGDYKKAYSIFGDKFPVESCREKIARRYGENSLAISGPCEGQPLVNCVCDQLKNAGVYTDRLAIKVAQIWSEVDGYEECVTDQVRTKLTLREAAVVCTALKSALASDEDFFADDLGESNNEPDNDTDNDSDDSNLDVSDDSDPFDGNDTDSGDSFGEESSTPVVEDGLGEKKIVIELSEQAAKELDAKLDASLGSDPTDDLGGEGEIGGAESVGLEGDMGSGGDLDSLNTDPSVPSDGGLDEVPGIGAATTEEAVSGLGDLETSKPALDPMQVKNKGIPGGNMVSNQNNPALQQPGDLRGVQGRLASENVGTEKEANHMRSSFNRTGKIELDLLAVANSLNLKKKAGEKQVSVELVQDSKDIGKISDGDPLGKDLPGAMGHEKESVPTAVHPSVPRSDARMGHEKENIDKEESLPSIPSDKGTIGHEDEQDLSGGDVRMTGGVGATGKSEVEASNDEITKEAQILDEVASMRGFGGGRSSIIVHNLVNRLVAASQKKQADKVKDAKPVSDSDSIGKVDGGGKGMANEESFSAEEPKNVKSDGNGSMMGHEKETLGDKPDSPKDHPDIPAGNALMGHEEDSINSEKQTDIKGTVIAGSNAESEARVKLATQVAAEMMQAGLISGQNLYQKINELKQYGPSQIRDYRKAIFANRKGLDTVSDGIERPVIISEASNQHGGQGELSSRIKSMFTLSKQTEEALRDPDFALKFAHRRM